MAVNLNRARNIQVISSRINSVLQCPSKVSFKSCNASFKNPFHALVYLRSFSVSSLSFAKKMEFVETDVIKPELMSDQENQDNHDYQELVHKMHLVPSEGHQVLIIQPYVKWGPKKNQLTTPDLMVEEAKALIDSLPNWKCVDTLKVALESMEKKHVFGVGVFENLRQKVVRNPNISAVFVSINLLRGIQRK